MHDAIKYTPSLAGRAGALGGADTRRASVDEKGTLSPPTLISGLCDLLELDDQLIRVVFRIS